MHNWIYITACHCFSQLRIIPQKYNILYCDWWTNDWDSPQCWRLSQDIFVRCWQWEICTVSEWAVLVCCLNKTKFGEIFQETLKQNSPDCEAPNTFRVGHRIWQTGGIPYWSSYVVFSCLVHLNKQIILCNRYSYIHEGYLKEIFGKGLDSLLSHPVYGKFWNNLWTYSRPFIAGNRIMFQQWGFKLGKFHLGLTSKFWLQ